MAKPPRSSDLLTVLRGLARVGSAAVDVRSQEMTRAWATSSVRPAVVEGATKLQETLATVIQQPQSLQSNGLKGVSEALSRLSMVTEGWKAYSSSGARPAAEFTEKFEQEENPLHEHKVEELNIEEIMMQEASNGPALTSFDGLERVQEEASKIVDKARSAKEEVSKRAQELESLVSIAKSEEKEITKEQLDILDEKVSELEGISHGLGFLGQEEKVDRDLNKEVIGCDHVIESAEHSGKSNTVTSAKPQELTIENIMMHEVINSYPDEVLSDSQRHLYNEVQGSADSIKRNIGEVEDAISQKIQSFEPLLDISNIEKQEITQEDLEAIDEKLSDLQDVAFGHNLKIFKEVENPKPVEEFLHDVTNQPSVLKEKTKSIETEEQAIPKPVQTKGSAEQSESIPELTSHGNKTTTELESSIAQIAKPVIVDDSFTSTVTDITAEAQVEPQMENIVNTETQPEGSSSFSSVSLNTNPIMPIGTQEAATAAASSTMAKSDSVASSTVVVAAAAAAAATSAAVTSPSFIPPDRPRTTLESNILSPKPKPKLLGRKPLAKEKPKSSLSENAQARKVPHSRISRLVSFGGLAAGLGMGTLAEVTRRSLGLRQGKNEGSLLDASPFLTEANAKRIVDTLCRVRGAALKLGQMLSIQDSALINPQLQKIFERVRQSADFMPTWQLEAAIRNQLGEEWRSKVATFDEKPFAAASIGQVHLATLHDGRSVAMKIQYPGVAEGIESDINNLVSSLKVANIFPEGLFVDSVIEVAKKELRWECDYIREAECTKRFKELVEPYPEFYVPEVIPELCTPQIFSTELIAGIPVDKCTEIDQESRNYISQQVLRLCLLELFQFGFMQTDPNWSNFFYDAETEQLALLDFGACREYSKDFVDKYINLIYGAAVKDRDRVHKYSQELGFLTGYEAKVMVDAHIDAIMILGEAFQENKPFKFGDQNTTYRIQNLVPVMLSHRMCAPPEESYSLHRKMSGVFLLCTKLNSSVNCYELFHEIFKNYKFGGTWEDLHAGKL